ncbi:MAG: phage tail protein, partial [Deltaproteobacteria bacterium]|nr:phage tail protein [Deltaproteobacteria bacterium]
TFFQLELPKNKYLTISDSENPNIGKLWWKYVPTASDSKWAGIIQGTYGKNIGQQIRYGKNINGITREIDESEIYTAIIPTGKNGMRLNQLNNTNEINKYVSAATKNWSVYKTEGLYSCIIMPSYADGVYGAYLWTAEGAALPAEIQAIYNSTDTWLNTSIKSTSLQGEDERSIKVLTSLLPSGVATVVYLPQPYLKNWNKIPIYGTRMKTIEMPACYNFEILKFMASRILVDMSVPRYSYQIEAADFYDDNNINFNLVEVGSIVKVDDEEMGINVSTYVLSKEKQLDSRGSMILELENRTKNWQDTYDRYQYLYGLSVILTTPSGRRTIDYWSKVMGYCYVSNGWTTKTHIMNDGSLGGIDIEGIDPNDKPKAFIGLLKFRAVLRMTKTTKVAEEGEPEVEGSKATISQIKIFNSFIPVSLEIDSGLSGTSFDVMSAGTFVETEQKIGFPFAGNGHYSANFSIYASETLWIQEIQIGVRALW